MTFSLGSLCLTGQGCKYLFVTVFERQNHGVRSPTRHFTPSTPLPRCPQWLELGQTKDGSQKLSSDFPCGWHKPSHLSPHHGLPEDPPHPQKVGGPWSPSTHSFSVSCLVDSIRCSWVQWWKVKASRLRLHASMYSHDGGANTVRKPKVYDQTNCLHSRARMPTK